MYIFQDIKGPVLKASEKRSVEKIYGTQYDHLDHTNNKFIFIFPNHCLNCKRSRSRKALRPRGILCHLDTPDSQRVEFLQISLGKCTDVIVDGKHNIQLQNIQT